MSDVFLSQDPTKALHELKEHLYDRLGRSRQLLKAYEASHDALGYDDRNDYERGYAQGVREEIGYFERLLSQIERS
jgi:hypothetical protein